MGYERIETKDKLVRKVLKKMDERSLIGQQKYGSTMYDEVLTGKKDLYAFITDTQEELMDAILYLEASKAALQQEVEEQMLRQFSEVDIDADIPDVDPRGYSLELSNYPGGNITCTGHVDCACGSILSECKFNYSQ